MNESIAKQIEYLRNEMASINGQLMTGLFILATLIVAGYIAAVATGKDQLYKLPVMLLITGLLFVARQEYMHHRPALWVERAEKVVQQAPAQTEHLPEGFSNWEEHHRNLKSRMFFLLPTDFLACVAFFWIFYECFTHLLEKNKAFVYWSAGGLAFALLWVAFAFWSTDK